MMQQCVPLAKKGDSLTSQQIQRLSKQQMERILVLENNCAERRKPDFESKPVTYVLVQEVVQSFSQTLPGELEQRNLQKLMKAQQFLPQTQHHWTR